MTGISHPPLAVGLALATRLAAALWLATTRAGWGFKTVPLS